MIRLLVDGNGVAVRTWWANATGCARRFEAAVKRALPSDGADILVCWDSPRSWRRDLFPHYKANRGPKPEALIEALKDCRGVFPGVEAESYEADDLLAAFAREASPEDVVLILTDDKDMLQLVAPGRIVVNSKGAVYETPADVVKRMGVPPEKIRHLLSWMGDTADGLPGVPGYGPKKAIAKALSGEIGNVLTYELSDLATVPLDQIARLRP